MVSYEDRELKAEAVRRARSKDIEIVAPVSGGPTLGINMERLNDIVDELERRAAQLGEVLSPILADGEPEMPVPPRPTLMVGDSPTLVRATASLGNRLMDLVDRLDGMITTVRV